MSNKRKKKYKELKKRIERERELSIVAQKMERKKQLTVSSLKLLCRSLFARKPVFRVFDKVQHKPGCTATDDG